MRKTYTRVDRISGNVIVVTARDVGYGELAFVSGGNPSLARVIKIVEDEVSLQVFNGTRGVSTGDQIRFLGRTMEVPFSEALLGRVFTGGGDPRDAKPKPPGEDIPEPVTCLLVGLGGLAVLRHVRKHKRLGRAQTEPNQT